MKWYRAEITITYVRELQAESKADAEGEMAADYADDDITNIDSETEEITKESRE
jgi:hypothetical protein